MNVEKREAFIEMFSLVRLSHSRYPHHYQSWEFQVAARGLDSFVEVKASWAGGAFEAFFKVDWREECKQRVEVGSKSLALQLNSREESQ